VNVADKIRELLDRHAQRCITIPALQHDGVVLAHVYKLSVPRILSVCSSALDAAGAYELAAEIDKLATEWRDAARGPTDGQRAALLLRGLGDDRRKDQDPT
jgi:hypothetical protein